MKILWYSDSPFTHSAYGKITDSLLPKLHEMGHEIIIQPKFGHHGRAINLGYAIMYGVTGGGSNSFENVGVLAKKYQIDIVVIMCEIWSVNIDELRKVVPNTLILTYLPNDTDFLSKQSTRVLKKLNYIIPMSDHCKKLLYENEDIDNEQILDTIYPPVSSVFVRDSNVPKHTQITGIKFDKIIGMVQMSKDILRKDQIRQMWAVKKAADITGLRIGLYLHMHPMAAFDVMKVAEELDFADNIIVPLPETYNLGWTDEQMAQMYNGIDILLQCTNGEGFGVPTAEAVLCGTPVVGVKNTATEELIKMTYPEFSVEAKEITVFRGLYSRIASFEDMVRKIAFAIEFSSKKKYRGSRLRKMVDPDIVTTAWDNALYEAFRRLEIKCGLVPPRSAELVNHRKEIIEVLLEEIK